MAVGLQYDDDEDEDDEITSFYSILGKYFKHLCFNKKDNFAIIQDVLCTLDMNMLIIVIPHVLLNF